MIKKEPSIILGIDPGLANVGWGVIESRDQNIRTLGSGCIITKANTPFPERLNQIYEELMQVVQLYKPEASSVEKIFFAKNTRTAITVAQARGVAILAATSNGIPCEEFTPLQIKQAVVGYGRATKDQVIKMVRVLANPPEDKMADHTADALAAAICYLNFAKIKRAGF